MDQHEQQVAYHSENDTNEPNEAGFLKRAMHAAGNLFANTGELFKENRNRITAAGVGAILTITLAGCGANAKAEGPAPTVTHSAEAIPTPTATSSEKELTVESVELPANLTPEQLGETFISRLTSWDMAGATPKNQDEVIASGGDAAKITDIVNKNEQIFTDAMFVENWEKVDSLKGFADSATGRNASAIETWFKTYQSGDSRDKEPYDRGMKIVSGPTIDSSDGNTATIEVHIAEYDNVDKNRGLTLDPTLSTVNGNRVKFVITAVKNDTSWKISSIAPYSEN